MQWHVVGALRAAMDGVSRNELVRLFDVWLYATDEFGLPVRQPVLSSKLRPRLGVGVRQVQWRHSLSAIYTHKTRRNTTGQPSRAAPWWGTLHMRVLQMTTTDDSDRY